MCSWDNEGFVTETAGISRGTEQIQGLIYSRSACVRKPVIACKRLRVASFNEQVCGFCTFVLTNMQHGTLLPERAKYGRENMQIRSFSTSDAIYEMPESECGDSGSRLNLTRLKRTRSRQLDVLICSVEEEEQEEGAWGK